MHIRRSHFRLNSATSIFRIEKMLPIIRTDPVTRHWMLFPCFISSNAASRVLKVLISVPLSNSLAINCVQISSFLANVSKSSSRAKADQLDDLESGCSFVRLTVRRTRVKLPCSKGRSSCDASRPPVVAKRSQRSAPEGQASLYQSRESYRLIFGETAKEGMKTFRLLNCLL